MEIINNIRFGTTDFKPIIGDLSLADHPHAPLVIFCHGFKGFKDWGSYPDVARRFSSSGFNFLKFNFSHNGGTEEQLIDFPDLDAFSMNNFSKEQEDLERVLSWLTVQSKFTFNPSKVFLLAHSRGGATAIVRTAEDENISGLCTWAGVSSIAERLNRYDLEKWKSEGEIIIRNGRTNQDMPMKYQMYEDYLANRNRFNIEEQIKKIKVPQLIVYAEDDHVVPMHEALRMSEWNKNAKLLCLAKGGHTFGAVHPPKGDSIPAELAEACDQTITFFKGI